jgi:hypothetical protein
MIALLPIYLIVIISCKPSLVKTALHEISAGPAAELPKFSKGGLSRPFVVRPSIAFITKGRDPILYVKTDEGFCTPHPPIENLGPIRRHPQKFLAIA